MTAQVRQLLSEKAATVRERERSTFDDLAGDARLSIVLFGAGGLGRRCLAGLRHHGIEPIAFADNNSRLWGTKVDGVPVLAPTEAVLRHSTAAFVITIWGARGPDRMTDRVRALTALGCKTVIPFGPLAWRYPDGILPHYGVDLPHKVLEQSPAILRAFDLFADERSRQEYLGQLRWRLWFDFGGMETPETETIYFPPDLVRLRSDEYVVDCGAFDGDTLRQFLAVSGGSFEKYLAFEPDPGNFARLTESVSALPDPVRSRIETVRAAISSADGTLRFSSGAGPSSHVGEGDLEVDAIALDRYLGEAGPTFIKMDIEGAEPDALRGAARHIRAGAPILAISCYHRQDHLWSIPLLINELNADYAFYLRPHDLEAWDLVCYAIPRSRLA